MTEFEFLSVLISMIFGLGLTHVLAGTMRYIYAGRASEMRVVYSLFTLVVLVLNWWVIFTWRGHASWSFDEFLVIVFWAISHYGLAITLYPADETAYTDFETHRHWFLWSFVIMAGFDIGQTVVVKDRAAVAVEAMEGTDEVIRRAGRIAGAGCTVVKVAKPRQDVRFDVPVVGPGTVAAMSEAQARVLAVQGGATLLLDRAELLAQSDRADVAVWGFEAPASR
jgi:hypothetical protein